MAAILPPPTLATPAHALPRQVDTADRGFSFLRDGPLDMRMDPAAPLSAERVVNEWPEAELGRVFREYGEERYWKSIARRWASGLAREEGWPGRRGEPCCAAAAGCLQACCLSRE